MRLPTFLLILSLILAACGTPTTDSPAAPSVKTEPTTVPVEPTDTPDKSVTQATFEDSLLAVEWKGRAKGNLLFPLDPATGAALPGYEPISFGQSYTSAFSPDRNTLAAVTFENDSDTNGNLSLVDLKTWETRPFELGLDGWVTAMVFSPDGKRIVIANGSYTYNLTVFDLEKGVVTAQKEEKFLIARLKFTADSESLMLYGTKVQNRFTENELNGGPPQVRLLDAGDLTSRWSVDLKPVRDGIYPTNEKVAPDLSQPGTAIYLFPGSVFAPDRNILYIAHADSDQLTIVDFDAQNVETLDVQPELSWFEQLLSLTAGVAYAKVADGTSKQAAVSPDGQFLYVVGTRSETVEDKYGNWQVNQTPLGLEIIRTSDGSLVERIETDAADLSLSTDGAFLYLRNWIDTAPWTEILNTSTGEVITREMGIYATPVLRMNGEPLLASTYSTSEASNRMSIFQPDGSQLLSEWSGSGYIAWLTP